MDVEQLGEQTTPVADEDEEYRSAGYLLVRLTNVIRFVLADH